MLRIAELRGHEIARIGAEDGEVGERVGADDLELQLAAVDEGCATRPVRAVDDVRGGEHEPVGGHGDGAAGAFQPSPAAHPARHAQVPDRGRQPIRDVRDDARVGVQCLRIAWGRAVRRVGLFGPENRVDRRDRHVRPS